ncbi:zinc finger protein 26-like [Cylas formicarius]|uniref:zinc finger protein 26-like n=1 Tax=Cylas formicarius TaxID=197179 RepID=UPI0029584A7B|nr:zinc finger protein 26-like [Cylas formicarius]
MEKLERTSILKLCISCLKEGGIENVLSDIYKNITILDILNLCTTIQLSKKEVETKTLCSECIVFLKAFYDFKERAIESYKILSNLNNHSLNLDNSHLSKKDMVLKTEVSWEALSDSDVNDNGDDNCQEISKEVIIQESFSQISSIQNQKSLSKLNKQLKLESKWQCGYCNIIFSTLNPQEIKKHKYMEKQNRIKVHECNICGKKFDSFRLKRHMPSHSTDKPVVCELCGKGLSSKYHLKKHMMLHNGKPHVCELCKKGFTERFLLKVHMNEHEKKESFMCSTCGKVFLTTIQLSVHVSRHAYEKKVQEDEARNQFTCEICGKTLASKTNLEIHLANHQKTDWYSCSYCKKKYTHKRQLKMHIIEHELQYRCKDCFKIFKKIDLKVHECQETNTNFTNYLPNECKICGKILLKVNNMKKHLQRHSARECQFCGEKFLSARKFRFHLNSHKLKCTLCNKGFAKKESLESHIENQVCIKIKAKKK